MWGAPAETELQTISEAGLSQHWDVVPRSPSSALLPFFGEGFPTKIDYRKKGTLILTSLLDDLGAFFESTLIGVALPRHQAESPILEFSPDLRFNFGADACALPLDIQMGLPTQQRKATPQMIIEQTKTF